MNGLSDESDSHLEAARDLPWLVNGTLGVEAAARLRVHLDECADCRSDYEAQLRLYSAIRRDDTLAFAAEPSFQKLIARIEGLEAAVTTQGSFIGSNGSQSGTAAAELPRAPSAAVARSRSRWLAASPRLVHWLAAAAVIEAVGLALSPWLLRSRPAFDAPYTTLSTQAPSYGAGERIRVVFRPGLPLAELAQLLRGIGAHIVDGPSEAGVYTLGFPARAIAPGELQMRVARLRASSEVVFAEPVDTGGRER